MVKYIRITSKICCLSYISAVLYSSRCNEVHAKTSRLFIVLNGGCITNYVTLSGCFGDVKAEGASRSTPSFIIFSPFYRLNEEKGR